MSIFSKLYWKIKGEKIKLFYGKVKKEALKLSFAVVVAESLMVGGFYFAEKYGIMEYFKPKTVYIVNEAHAKTITEAPETTKIEDTAPASVESIADTIYTLESSQGVNNYSKCAAIGKINTIGYGISGGKYMCFKDHAEEMKVLEGWITEKRARGLGDTELLCLYSGNNYKLCK